jgi:hypothetical protein
MYNAITCILKEGRSGPTSESRGSINPGSDSWADTFRTHQPGH